MNPMMDPVHAMRPGVLQLSSLPPLSLYVHLPWCIKKCPYCDFNSHEWRDNSQAMPEQRYIDALLADLETSLPLVWGRPVHSVFIGGGTPSLFTPSSIDRLISGIRARLPLEAEAEITLEANPGTFEKDRFKAFRAAGVTRLSIGVQSFNDGHLKALGRVHNRDQAMAAVEEAQSAFETFNLDLMYALPGQTLADLTQDIETALSFKPPHISIYHLTIEPNTMFAKVLSISDVLMWRWYTLLSFKSMADIEILKKQVADGLNPKEAKVALAKEITARFHGAAAAEAAEQDFINRSKGGIPDEIPEVSLSGAPLGIGALLKAAGLAPSGSEANRLIDGGGVRIDGAVVSDKGLKVEAGTVVLQVGKRKFARVTLSA